MKAIQLTCYPIEYFQSLFSEERWEEIIRIINHWINPELKDGKIYKSIVVNPETGLAFIAHEGIDKIADHTMEYMQKQVLEKVLSSEEIELCNSKGLDAYQERMDKKTFENANKWEEKDWHDEPIFYGGDFYSEGIYELRDRWDYDEPLPEYVHGSIVRYTINNSDLKNAIYDMIENCGEIGDDYAEVPEVPDYLQEAWNRFVEENRQIYYEEDKDTVIILDKTKQEDE